MPDKEEEQYHKDLQLKAEELKSRTFEEESRRIAREAEERAQQVTKSRLSQDAQYYNKKLQEAHDERRREESALKSREEEVLKRLRKEAEKKIDARKRTEVETRRREQEEQKRLQEEERRRAEEQQRARREEERRSLVETERKKAEEERLRRDDEIRRKEEDRRRKEEDVREQSREREQRIQELIAKAEALYGEGDFERASVEVAKALVNDAAHPQALDLEQKIKEARGKKVEGSEEKEKLRKRRRPIRRERPPITGRRKRFAPALMIAAAVAIIIVSTLVILELKRNPSPLPTSIAVLPWSSSSDALEENILGSALAEETAARLREFPTLIVMDYSSSYQLARHVPEPDLAGSQVGFRFALRGTIARSGTGYSISVRLLDSVRHPVWSQEFNRTPETLPTAADEISRQLAASFGAGRIEKAAGFRAELGPTDPDAYVLYLRGLELLHRSTPESTQNALLLLEQATHQDENFSRAFATAASVLALRAERGWDVSDTVLMRARQFAERSIALDPANSEGYRALGEILSQRKDDAGALRELDTALKYDPTSAQVLLSRAKVLLKLGKYADAIDALARGYDVSPRDPSLLQTFALAHQFAGTIRQGSWYHLTALNFAADSIEYLVGPFADAVILDPELSVSQSNRVDLACRRRLRSQPGDYVTMYRLARLMQVTGRSPDAGDLLGKTETMLRQELQSHPRDVRAMMYLALILTREGKFPDATALALKASAVEKSNAEVKYKTAQMYSLQMFSRKENTIDEQKKEEALKALREAVALSYRFDELASADFYNMFERADFRSAIKETL